METLNTQEQQSMQLKEIHDNILYCIQTFLKPFTTSTLDSQV